MPPEAPAEPQQEREKGKATAGVEVPAEQKATVRGDESPASAESEPLAGKSEKTETGEPEGVKDSLSRLRLRARIGRKPNLHEKRYHLRRKALTTRLRKKHMRLLNRYSRLPASSSQEIE